MKKRLIRTLGTILTTTLTLPASGQLVLHSLEGAGPNLFMGFAVESAEDVDMDGVDDLLVFTLNEAGFAGTVRLLSGRDSTEIRVWNGAAAFDQFGWSLGSLPDVDGDGVRDVLIGAPAADAPSGANAGRLELYSTGSGGVLWSLEGSAGEFLGSSLAVLDDLDGDGTPDLAVGALLGVNPNGFQAGTVRVLSGRTGALLYRLDGDQQDDWFGASVAALEDYDLDGHVDFLVGIPGADAAGLDSGRIRLYSGLSGALLFEMDGLAPRDELGTAVARAGDADQDGVLDWIVGAPRSYFDPLKGQAFVISGKTRTVQLTLSKGSMGSPGSPDGAHFGASVDGIGDQDGDGYDDVVVGARAHGPGGSNKGAVWMFSGRDGSELGAWIGEPLSNLGTVVRNVGDLNADGRPDLAFGAPGALGNAGQVQVVLLGCDAVTTYCSAQLNSQGCLPSISATGALSLTLRDDLRISANNLINQKAAILFYGTSPNALPLGGGTLCVSPPIRRTPVVGTGGSFLPAADCTGAFDLAIDAAFAASEGWVEGDRIYAQIWYRDPGFTPVTTSGLTDAVSFQVCR